MCLGHSEGWKPPKVRRCTCKKCPRMRNLVCLAGDTAIQPVGHIRGPNKPILGPTDTVSGPHGPKNSQKATQAVPKVILSINLDNRTFWAPQQRQRGPFLGGVWAILGPLGAPPGGRPGHGHSGAWSTLAAGIRAFRVPRPLFAILTPCRIAW